MPDKLPTMVALTAKPRRGRGRPRVSRDSQALTFTLQKSLVDKIRRRQRVSDKPLSASEAVRQMLAEAPDVP